MGATYLEDSSAARMTRLAAEAVGVPGILIDSKRPRDQIADMVVNELHAKSLVDEQAMPWGFLFLCLKTVSPHRSCRNFASAPPHYCGRNGILRCRGCVG